MITTMLTATVSKTYTYSDYLRLPEGRFEIINGKLRDMTPAPGLEHQAVSRDLGFEIYRLLKEKSKKCQVFYAPIDVILSESGDYREAENVVQPDIVVVCDETKLRDFGILGAPELVVEIVSPNSVKYDLGDKFKLYERFGVKEYWIVFPKEKFIQVYELKGDKFEMKGVFAKEDIVEIKFLGITVDLKNVF